MNKPTPAVQNDLPDNAIHPTSRAASRRGRRGHHPRRASRTRSTGTKGHFDNFRAFGNLTRHARVDRHGADGHHKTIARSGKRSALRAERTRESADSKKQTFVTNVDYS